MMAVSRFIRNKLPWGDKSHSQGGPRVRGDCMQGGRVWKEQQHQGPRAEAQRVDKGTARRDGAWGMPPGCQQGMEDGAIRGHRGRGSHAEMKSRDRGAHPALSFCGPITWGSILAQVTPTDPPPPQTHLSG